MKALQRERLHKNGKGVEDPTPKKAEIRRAALRGTRMARDLCRCSAVGETRIQMGGMEHVEVRKKASG